MDNIYFIGGIHGVGKGTICRRIEVEFKLIHLTASEILKWKEISDIDNKFVKDFEETQNRLLLNLCKITIPSERYLLDGHYCLLNSEKKPERINQKTFEELNPKAFIIVTDEINLIKDRLEKRDNKEYDSTVLKQFQDLELEYSILLAEKLNKPLIKVTNGDYKNLLIYLKNESIT